ncbi:MAG: hypothetical protein JXA13_13655 [Anaerolineales bacterium]|nr:hypothetical protein [Anaerolineales bacterium]
MDLNFLLSGMVSFLFTMMILSYLLGDNVLFRIGIYLFVGASAGYVTTISIQQVILPRLITPLLNGQNIGINIIILLLAVLVLMKMSQQLSGLGTPVMAGLAGIGAAIAIGGALSGTLFPQIGAAIRPFDLQLPGSNLFRGMVTLAGTICTLVYFQFGAKKLPDGSTQRSQIVEILARIGQFFIAVTFGMLFAGVYATALAALSERLDSILAFLINQIIFGLFF